jgi:hypothetical protein
MVVGDLTLMVSVVALPRLSAMPSAVPHLCPFHSGPADTN